MIVFDCGEVLTDHGDAMARMASVVGVPEPVLAQKFWDLRRPYDEGQGDLDYWRAVLARLGKQCDEETALRLADIDLGQWAQARPAVLELLDRLADRGERLVMLSNAPVSFRGHLEEAGWTGVFEALVISGELGHAKPAVEMYEAVEAIAGGEPIRFVDDRHANVDVAADRGWDAHVWVSDDDTREWLGA